MNAVLAGFVITSYSIHYTKLYEFRIFNPVTQSIKFDSEGAFIRHFVPELRRVSNERIHAPWQMTPLEQQAANCIVGRDYPAPIVDHDVARKRTLARYAVVRKAQQTR